MKKALLEYAAQCYGAEANQLRPLEGGHYNAVYEFTRDGRTIILRISPEDANLLQTVAMMDYVDFLAENGAPVARPLASIKNRWVEQITVAAQKLFITAFEKSPGVLAERIPPDDWVPPLYRATGKAVGSFHQVAAAYKLLDGSLRRPDWETLYTPQKVAAWLGPQQADILALYESVYNYLRSLPKDAGTYGLGHGDLHFANFTIDRERIILFDFDDCCYTWFARDIAMNLFDALVICPAENKESFAVEYLQAFLAGYRSVRPLAPFWVSQFAHFLKLEEIYFYAMLCPGYDPQDDDPWVNRFMPGRRERIAEGIPYVNLNFIQLSKQI